MLAVEQEESPDCMARRNVDIISNLLTFLPKQMRESKIDNCEIISALAGYIANRSV